MLQQRFASIKKTSMNQQKEQDNSFSTKKKIKQNQLKQQDTDLKIIVHSGELKKFHFLAQQPQVQPTPSAETPQGTLLWRTPFPNPAGVRKRLMVFRQLRYIISNWTGDKFPSVIYLTVDGISALCDRQGEPTNRVAALELQQISPVLDDATLRTHDLKYMQTDVQVWQLPSTMTQIRLRVKVDAEQSYTVLPLPNPFSISFQIRASM